MLPPPARGESLAILPWCRPSGAQVVGRAPRCVQPCCVLLTGSGPPCLASCYLPARPEVASTRLEMMGYKTYRIYERCL